MDLPSVTSGETSFQIGHYIVVSNKMTPKEEAETEYSLRLVPVKYAVISDLRHAEIATRFGITDILRVKEAKDAFQLAEELFEIEDARSLIITPEGAAC